MDKHLRNALIRHPGEWPEVAWRAAVTLVRRLRAPKFVVPTGMEDPEAGLFVDRANAALAWARHDGIDAAWMRLDQLLSRTNLADDPYSCSQRIANTAYLVRLSPAQPLSPAAWQRLRADAAKVMHHPEFRLSNPWFNNHLLNNYRALVLARSQLPELRGADLEAAIDRIDRLLVRHASTLFEDGQGPVLAEGSVSYELLILRHLIDIVCAGGGAFAALAGEWLREAASAYIERYRWRDRWLLPAIGDLSPDWGNEDIIDFLDGVFLGRPTLYRSVWVDALARAGVEPISRVEA